MSKFINKRIRKAPKTVLRKLLINGSHSMKVVGRGTLVMSIDDAKDSEEYDKLEKSMGKRFAQKASS